MDTTAAAPQFGSDRHFIWLRLCYIASIALATVQVAQVPSNAIPLDAPNAPPQTATKFIVAIPAAHLPADPVKTQQVRDLLTDL